MSVHITDTAALIPLDPAIRAAILEGRTTHRVETKAEAQAAVEDLNASTDRQWFCYHSSYVCDPWVVAAIPIVGEKVSKAFNGDSYPEGEIVSVSPSGSRIVTSTGCVFHRQKKRPGCWLASGTWSMTPGHVEKRNPHF